MIVGVVVVDMVDDTIVDVIDTVDDTVVNT
jgi:hypothetical protein